MKIKATITQRRKVRSSRSVFKINILLANKNKLYTLLCGCFLMPICLSYCFSVAPYPKQNWHGTLPGNAQFGPIPVWNVPPPPMPLMPAFMPQNQLVAYDPQPQNDSVAYNSRNELALVPYDPYPQNEFVPCDPYPQNDLVPYDPHPGNELVAYDPHQRNHFEGYEPQNQLVAYDPPPPVQNVSPLPPQFLYHYTDYTGMCSIVGEKYIRKSCPAQNNNTGGAWYGSGVYLTAVPPSAPDNVILINNWNDDGLNTPNSAWNGAKAARLQYCFVISSMALAPWALEKVKDYNGRNIWVYRCEITLGDKVVALRRRW